MGRPSNRDRILSEGLKVVHERGFGGASVRDIVQAAGAPQGSFTNHFASKDAFGLEVIDLYYAHNREAIALTLGDSTRPPLERLRAYVDASVSYAASDRIRAGCLLGNFTAEFNTLSEPLRARLTQVFREMAAALRGCLEDAVAAGELPRGFDCVGTASFILSSMQGASLMAKLDCDPAPLAHLREVLFGKVLRA